MSFMCVCIYTVPSQHVDSVEMCVCVCDLNGCWWELCFTIHVFAPKFMDVKNDPEMFFKIWLICLLICKYKLITKWTILDSFSTCTTLFVLKQR